MKYEAAIDRASLLEHVHTAYGLAVEAITFVPIGYVAACYAVRCPGGERYFLKLWPDTATGRWSSARQAIILPLVRAIYERGVYRGVAYPLVTRDNALWATFQGDRFAVFPYLPGDHAPLSAWPQAFADEYARTLAAIHRGTALLEDVLPPRETYSLSFEPGLLASLPAIAAIGPQARPDLQALRDLMAMRRDDLLAQIERLRALQARVRALPGPEVLCHTDLAGDNILVDEDGRLSLLDWDGAVVATPEYDLKEAVGEDFSRFIAVYLAAGGAQPLEADRFAFYLLHRYLEDFSARVVNILHHNTTAEQDEDDLEGMEVWGVARWNQLDATLVTVTTALRDTAS
ncbi:MAG TPA: aminoglycoside phosphotransferase family protein [Ktedonobacterales bacterium]|nr:aminoglycoside phosphotransferase family protein [Ktedonobacterales bacterium]